MIDLNDPKLNRKKKQKIIRELYDEIEREVSEIKDEIKESSPLSLWWKTPQKQEDRIMSPGSQRQVLRFFLSTTLVHTPSRLQLLGLYMEF